MLLHLIITSWSKRGICAWYVARKKTVLVWLSIHSFAQPLLPTVSQEHSAVIRQLLKGGI